MPLALTISPDNKPPQAGATIHKNSNLIESKLHRAYINPLLEKHNSGKGGITYEDLVESWNSVNNCATKLRPVEASDSQSIQKLETIKVSSRVLCTTVDLETVFILKSS